MGRRGALRGGVFSIRDVRFAAQTRRFYVTPQSFLELISLYLDMLQGKRDEMMLGIKRLEIGIKKLNETNALVDGMQAELTELREYLEGVPEQVQALERQITISMANYGVLEGVLYQLEASDFKLSLAR